mmetsp:Transcript_85110/g.186877  ORF Transcript_85110/g.186877 Transcript_85110/m.186877 type:complete len:204 (+) Transcript_85110:673-1284(+)
MFQILSDNCKYSSSNAHNLHKEELSESFRSFALLKRYVSTCLAAKSLESLELADLMICRRPVGMFRFVSCNAMLPSFAAMPWSDLPAASGGDVPAGCGRKSTRACGNARLLARRLWGAGTVNAEARFFPIADNRACKTSFNCSIRDSKSHRTDHFTSNLAALRATCCSIVLALPMSSVHLESETTSSTYRSRQSKRKSTKQVL